MVSATLGSNSNPKKSHSSKNTKNVYPIGGLQVEFPYQPYGSQLAFMCRVISTLDRALKDGHCHALLESPTGTGKSLSLLCSSLAWQQNCKSKNLYANLSHSKPAPEAMTDPLGHGGGFIPETHPSGAPQSANSESAQSEANSKSQKKKTTPTIFYASRTHSQISQVIREYRKTGYRVPMAVLASRKHYCTNPYIRGKENIDEECKLLLSDRSEGCFEFKNMHKVKHHPSLQKGGCHEAHDIEDLVKVGQVVKGCSYYAARAMADDAQLVFCPYSYIINPVIRGAMDVDVKGAILILDEAHNIEDIARDAGSMDVEEDVLLKLQTELQQLCSVDTMIYQPLCEMIQDLVSWIERKKSTLEKREFQRYFSSWTGDKALRQLEEASISKQCFTILLECATKAIKVASDTESEVPHLSGMAVTTLEGLFSSLTYFFSRNGTHIFDYHLALQRYVKRDGKNAIGSWTCSLSLWCLNPAVVFRDIADLSLSIILTSGTLSPMNSFSSELGVQFGTCLEAPHVIDVESQVWAAMISNGPANYPLNASYKTADAFEFQDELGKSLEEICKVVPGGSLVFFPSYKLMEKLCNRWRETGQWSQLNARKSFFIEPRGGSPEELEPVLKGYYDSIRGRNKPTIGKRRKIKKTDVDGTESSEITKKEGAAFLAVCRGKVSEGIDFSDDNARVVIVVGIPFPNINDIQVSLKKKYNDMHKSSKNLLSGSEWYCHQAFRALNQAIGRCIRHRDDYGAIILLDGRFQDERNRGYISKWLRKSIRKYESFDESIDGLRSFFRDVKDHVGKNRVGSLNSSHKEENVSSMDPSKEFIRNKNSTANQSNLSGQGLVSVKKCDANFPLLNPQGDVAFPIYVRADKEDESCKTYIDPECSFPKDSWSCDTLSMTLSNEDPEIILVKETPIMDAGVYPASPASFSKDRNSSSAIIHSSTESPNQSLLLPVSSNLSKVASKYDSMITSTPQKHLTENNFSLISEQESSLNLSVSSLFLKRKKSTGSPLINLVDEESNGPNGQISGCKISQGKLVAIRDATRRIEFGFEASVAECKSKKLNLSQCPTINNDVASCPVMDKRLQISCSLCRSPLGLPENHLYISCLLTSSSKAHLISLLKEKSEHYALTTIPVIMTDTSSVNPRLCNRTLEDAPGQGIWCKEDGCVFNNIFCPFCSIPNNCLGVQIVATDAHNFQLLNKILLYLDRLKTRNMGAAEDKTPKDKGLVPANCSGVDKTAMLNSIEKFSYSPQQQDSGGWRSTKSKLKLPKKELKVNGNTRDVIYMDV